MLRFMQIILSIADQQRDWIYATSADSSPTQRATHGISKAS